MNNSNYKVLIVMVAALILAACAGGSTRVSYGMGTGYGGYYGGGPWRGYSRYPVYVGGGGGGHIPHIPDGPSASQMPDMDMGMGMPDVGMMDMGGFDF